MNVAVVAEKESDALVGAFASQGAQTTLTPIGDIVLSVEQGVPEVRYGGVSFDKIDGVLLQVSARLMLFAEPLLTELAERGIYCQLKPTSFNLFANKPFLYTTLKTHGANLPHTTLVSSVDLVDAAIGQYAYPVFLEAFHGTQKQQMIAESKMTLRSFLKSLPFTFDVLTIREFLKGDLCESVVIGDEVLTTKRTWNREKLHYGKKRTSTKLSSAEIKGVRRAANAVGADIAVVKTINGYVVDVEHIVDMEGFGKAMSVDIPAKIAKHYKRKLS